MNELCIGYPPTREELEATPHSQLVGAYSLILADRNHLRKELENSKPNWLLISGIFSGLQSLEENEEWDLSIGENAELVRSFYESLKDGLPKSKDEWLIIFEKANVACWGSDHTCDPTNDNELWLFIAAIADCYSHEKYINPTLYCKLLGITYTVDEKKIEFANVWNAVESKLCSFLKHLKHEDKEQDIQQLEKILKYLEGFK